MEKIYRINYTFNFNSKSDESFDENYERVKELIREYPAVPILLHFPHTNFTEDQRAKLKSLENVSWE